MVRFVWASVVAALGVACLASSPARAHTIAIDGQGTWVELGSASAPYCNPCQVTTSFNLNAGSGPTNQIYVYDTGLISIGSAFPSGAPSLDPSNITASSTNFLSLYYDTDPAFTPMLAYDYLSPTEDDVYFWTNNPDYGLPAAVGLELTPNSGNPGAFTATWAFDSNEVPFNPGMPDDTAQGYPLNGYQFGSDTNYSLPNVDSTCTSNCELTASFDYAAGAPEPATWALTIVGAGLVGFALRRRRLTVA